KLRERWRKFFFARPWMIWNVTAQIPRVFARELLGLKAFGYRPTFFECDLLFTCKDYGLARRGDFKGYLKALADVRFAENNRETIVGAICEFLFEDKEALKGLGVDWKKA